MSSADAWLRLSLDGPPSRDRARGVGWQSIAPRAQSFIHCETPAWIEARDLFLGAVDAINVSSFGTGIREGALIAILGESHSGKTHILRRLSWHIQLQEDTREQGLYRPLVRVKVRAPTTMKA